MDSFSTTRNKRVEIPTKTNSFFNRLIDIDSKLKGRKVYGNAYEFFNHNAGSFARYFVCEVSDKTISL